MCTINTQVVYRLVALTMSQTAQADKRTHQAQHLWVAQVSVVEVEDVDWGWILKERN